MTETLFDRIRRITLKIEEMEIYKRNHARRMNYKIKKLRDLSVLLSKGEESEQTKEELWSPENKKTGNIKNNAPVDFSKTLFIEDKPGYKTEVWLNNIWRPIQPEHLLSGDVMRQLDPNGLVVKINGIGFFIVIDSPFSKNKEGLSVIEVKYGGSQSDA